MPEGFSNVMFPAKSTNTFNLSQNCYYCSIAALLNKTVGELISESETMQQDTATKEEIITLFNELNVNVEAYQALDEEDAYKSLTTFPTGTSVGLAYARSNGTVHMIVVTRDEGYVNNFVNEGVKCVDYQMNPPKVTGFPPESGDLIYTLFYKQ